GGWLGSVHSFRVKVQSPTNGSSFRCSGPGLPASARAFSRASGLGELWPSPAQLRPASTSRPSANAAVMPIAFTVAVTSFSFVTPSGTTLRFPAPSEGSPARGGVEGPRRECFGQQGLCWSITSSPEDGDSRPTGWYATEGGDSRQEESRFSFVLPA